MWSQHSLAFVMYVTATGLHMLQTVIIKKTSINANLNVNDLILIRSVIGVIAVTPFVLAAKNIFKTEYIKPNLKIAFFYIIATYGWHYGSRMVPINNASIISFTVPIIVTILSALILKERIRVLTKVSIAICTLIVFALYHKPSSIVKLNYGYIILIIDVFAYSIATILRKQSMAKQKPIGILYFNLLCIMPVGFLFSPKILLTLSTLQGQSVVSIVLIGITYLSESYFMLKAYSMTQVSNLQVAKYSRIVFSILMSYFILGEAVSVEQVIFAGIVFVVQVLVARRKE